MKSGESLERSEEISATLLQIVRDLAAELHPNHRFEGHITLDSEFEKDLGLDSLARVELISRVEEKFNLALPEQIYAEAGSPRDLLRALLSAKAPRTPLSVSEKAEIVLGEVESVPAEAQTLLEMLEWHVARHPDRPHIRFYKDDDSGETITYAQLRDGALKVAARLQACGIQPAEPVAIMLPTSRDYFFSFYGILMAGGIPVPIYPPARPSQLEEHMRRHAHILNNCLASVLITVPEALRIAKLLKGLVPGLNTILSSDTFAETEENAVIPSLKSTDIAFLQYTSGSTGNPKGVILTHANLLANIRAMGRAIRAGSDDVFVSWLPLYHDMGLIGAWLGSLYYATLLVIMSPLDFLARPTRWLRAIHRYRGTLSASPNFGYEYTLRRLERIDLKDLDLSSWRCAFNGAEAVSPQTLEQFTDHFAAYGFKKSSMMPVYGLAEASVGLTFTPLGRGALVDRIERETFMRTGEAHAAKEGEREVLRFVSSGLPLPGYQIRVVDSSGRELPERMEGRLEFQGPSSTSGYYRAPEKTKELFDGEWLDTGDLAYIAGGELYVTGRIKDIIIRAGRNVYPDELERMIGEIPGIRSGRVAIFGMVDERSGTERLVVLAETRISDPARREELRQAINLLALDTIGMPPDEIVLAPPGSVLKTSSGKIRRAASRELYERGEIGKKERSLSLQLLHLTLKSLLPRVERFMQSVGTRFYALYAWSVLVLLAPVAWLGTMLMPTPKLRWKLLQRCARVLAASTGTVIRIKGLEHFPRSGTYIAAANHASYIDAFVLTASLPAPLHFVAKAELAENPFLRMALKRIGTEFVERFDTEKSLHDTAHLRHALESGRPLLFFPEGTFGRVPGLGPFHTGAFLLAAETGLPVVPIAIRGTRSILRSGSWFPHRGDVTVEIGEPVETSDILVKHRDNRWKTAMELRDRCRDFILRHCGEPDISAP